MRVRMRSLSLFLLVALISSMLSGFSYAEPSDPVQDEASVTAIESLSDTGLVQDSPPRKFLPAIIREQENDAETRFFARMGRGLSSRMAPRSVGGYGIHLDSGEQIRFVPRGGANVAAEKRAGLVTYPNVWPGTAIRLTPGIDRLKEEIVLNAPGTVSQWQFDLHTSGLKVWSEGDAVLIGKVEEAEPSLRIADLVAVDAAGAETAVQLTLSDEPRPVITLSVDPSWLNDAARQYPVSVDPTVVQINSTWSRGKVWELTDGTLVAVSGSSWRVSKDGGATWLTPVTSTFLPSTSYWFSDLEIMPDGTVHFVTDRDASGTCTTGSKYELRYYRGVLSADRLSVTWQINNYLIASVGCNDYSNLRELVMGVYDAGTYSYVHLFWYQVDATSTMPYYAKYRRLQIMDSTPSVYNSGSITSVGTLYWVDEGYGPTDLAVDKASGHAVVGYSGATSSASDGYLYTNLYYAVIRWSGSSYYALSKYSWCTASPATDTYCFAERLRVIPDGGGRFKLFDEAAQVNREVTVTTSASPTSRVLAETYLGNSNKTYAADSNGDVWAFWADSTALYKREWNRASNTWGPDTIVFSPPPGGGGNLYARIGPSYNSVDLVGGNPLSFIRMRYDAPAISNMVPASGGWVTSVTPTVTWKFTDPNAGDTQSAYRVVLKNTAGTVIHDSGRVNSSVASHAVPAGKLVAAGTYKWQVTAWDNVGNGFTSTEATFSVDTSLPTGSLTVNRGGSTTNTTSVYLTLSAADTGSGLKDMQLSSNGTNWSAWEPVVSNKWYTMSAGNGTRTVSVRYRDVAGNVATFSDSILLDTTKPTAQVTISNGVSSTPNSAVTLAVSAVNNPTQMRFKNEAATTWSAWEPYATTKAWSLTEGYGARTVSVEVSDLNGTTAAAADSVELTLQAPANLRAWGETDHIYLQWNASVTTATTGYDVYRTTTAGSGYAKINVAPVTTLDYRDSTAVIGTRYFYVVRSVNSLGQSSPLTSNEVNAVSGAYPVGSLGVTAGSTSGPGGQLSLTARSETAVQWSGIEWRQKGTTAWNLQSGSGTVTPGVAFTVSWQVPSTPAPYEIRVKLVDNQARVGQTSMLALTLPAVPSAPAVQTGSVGNLLVQWTGDGVNYDLERSATATFANTELVVGGTTAKSLEMPFNGVANPSFEVSDANGLPVRWTLMGTGTYSSDAQTAEAGKASLRITSSAAGGIDGAQQRVFEGPGLSGRPLTASARVRLQNVTGTGVALRLRYLDRAGNELGAFSSPLVTGTSAWQTLRVTAWSPLNTYRVYLESTLSNATGTVWLDSVQVYPELTARAQFVPGLTQTKAHYRVRAWNGPLFNLSAPVWRTVSPFPSDLGLWAWEY